jgi:serine/threonine protein kinase/tetratricopeptide (TPR) repeat protein
VPQSSAVASLLEPGFKLGRYRLLEPIGAGGMGEVWKAHDDNLDRDVAVKMLLRGTLGHATRRERFRREALVLSRLSHPGVATIFDFDVQQGYDFLVMEYVAGGTLESRIRSGPLPIDDILTIGAAIADALDNAHRHGILHRDLKPGNVVMTADGHPKILDFGLAVLLSGGNDIGRMTQPGMIVGSLPYMAPEQLFGEADDARTDIYALGVLLFEMITGNRPFVKDRPESLMFAIVNTAAPSVRTIRSEVPEPLERLVAECLRKPAEQRPPSAGMVAQTLRGIRDGATTGTLALPPRDVIRAIAVLPLRNISSDSSQEYFTDGMTEAIISDLARIKALRVISRTSVMTYKGASKPVPEIARELNVDAVLEGSALLIGDRVRVSVQLISARTDDTLWSERYDRELSDVLSLQGELAATVAKEIAIHLTPVESRQLSAKTAVNPQAHVEYLKARHSLYVASPEAVAIGRRHAQRALDIDPEFALAWTVLADCSIWSAIRGMSAPGEAVPEATRAAQKALEIDPSLPEAHGSMGIILMHSGDPAGGVASLQRAVALNPGFADAHSLLGRGLYAFERHEEALASAEKAVTLDPLSMLMRTGAGDAYYFARDYEKSVFHCRMAIELDPRFDGTHTGLARSLEALGRFDEARAELELAARLSGGLAGASFGLAHLAAASGDEAEARRMLGELIEQRSTKVVSAWGIAVLHASLGDVDEAYRWLDIAIDEHAAGLILVRAHPRLDGIRSDPRYPELVKRVGLG